MTTRRPWELHTGQHVRWGGTVITVLHEPELTGDVYHVPARRADDGHQVDAVLPLQAEVESADRDRPLMTMELEGWPHTVGDTECGHCWSGFPRDCDEEGCGGLVHAEFMEESYDSVYLTYRCDRCGETRPPD